MDYVYLDHAAGSFPKAPGVAEVMADAVRLCGGNINRSTYALSTDTALRVMEAREVLADFFGCAACERLVFTPGATYSINAVLRGVLKKSEHVVISAMEHNAVWRTAVALSQSGIELSIAPCNGDGLIMLDKLEELLRRKPRLLMLAHASNVNGAVQDIPAVAELCRKYGVMLALDAAQTAGHIPIDLEAQGLDAVCFPGHKGLCGPQGIGGIALSERMAALLEPYITGGTGSKSSSEKMPLEYPDHLEAGTPNLPGIMGLAAALEHIKETGLEKRREKETVLTARMLEGMRKCKNIRFPGPAAEKRVGVISVDFEKMDNAQAAERLELEYGILTRCGLHCAPLAHKSLGTYPQGTVRLSFGWATAEKDVDAAVAAIIKIASDK